MDTQPPLPRTAMSRWFTGIRTQLWLAVNVPLAVLVVLFLAYDYRRELAERWDDKRIALDDEAKTLLPAVLQIHRSNPAMVREYIDSVCARMRDDESPGHHIAAVLADRSYQSSAHHRPSPGMLKAMQNVVAASTSPETERRFGMIVGAYREGTSAAYVAERWDTVRRAVVADVGRRLAGASLLAFVGLGALNVALSRIVARPLARMITTVQEIGSGKLGATVSRFASAEFNYLAGEINAMSQSLAEADRERAAQLRKARLVQENLLPSRITTTEMRTDYVFRPVDGVSGDYVDVLRLHDGSWLLCIADATGHGVPAALNAAMVKTLLLTAAERLDSPTGILHFLNGRLLDMSLEGDFVSMLLARFQPEKGLLEVASAGHEPAWLLAADATVRQVASTGPLLGITEAATWTNEAFEVVPGERLLMVTDGVTETMNPQRSCFGRERLVGVLAAHRQRSLKNTVDSVEEETSAFRAGESQHDDFTVLLAEFDDFRVLRDPQRVDSANTLGNVHTARRPVNVQFAD